MIQIDKQAPVSPSCRWLTEFRPAANNIRKQVEPAPLASTVPALRAGTIPPALCFQPIPIPDMSDPTTPAPTDAADFAGGAETRPDFPQNADPLTEALHEAGYWKDVAMRAAAELENYRKRVARDMQEAAKYSNASLLESLLPVLDNFDYGMQAAKQEAEGSNLYIGLSMVLKQIQDFLTSQGVQEIPSVGHRFDPNIHEAVSQTPSATAPEGIVLQQVRRGYKLRERLLRPASVVVSSGAAAAAPQS
jgi:molecular chaperone GrpE